MEPMDSLQDFQSNMPAIGAMFMAGAAIFGNVDFMLAPSQTGEVNFNFTTVPYFSLEAQLYMAQMNAPTAPTSITSGQNIGQQNTQGQFTVTDNAGNVRIAMGSTSSNTGSY